MRNFCTKCGGRITGEDKYCGNCGAPLSAGPGQEGLNSVLVKELDSGDIVFFRPHEPEQADNGPPEQEPKPEGVISNEYDQSDTLSVSSGVPSPDGEPAIEAAEVTEASETDSEDRFSPLPPLEKLPVLESNCTNELQESYPFPPDVPVLEKLKQLDEMSLSQGNAQEKAEPVMEPDSGLEDEIDESVRRFLNDEPQPNPKNDTITLFGWVGIIFLLLIPAVNVLLLIIWALGGCRKKQKARFARALLIVIAIIALLIYVGHTFFKDYIDNIITDLIRWKEISIEFATKFFESIIETVNTWVK